MSGRATSILSERLDRQRRLRPAQPIPSFLQLLLVLGRPLDYHGADAAGRIALNDSKRRNADDQFTVFVERVEMRNKRSDDQHPDDNPIEFRNHWHRRKAFIFFLVLHSHDRSEILGQTTFRNARANTSQSTNSL